MLVTHLAIDAVQGFFTALNFGADSRRCQSLLDRLHNLADDFTAIAARCAHRFRDRPVAQREHMRKRQILQFAINIIETQPVGDGNVHLHRLARNPTTLVDGHCIERAHIVQSVGELHENDAHIARHGQQHLAKIFCLLLNLTLKFDLVEFRQAIDKRRHRRAEALNQFVFANILILHHIMQQGRHDRLCIELPFGANFGNGNRMRNIRLARFTNLTQMHFIREAIRFLDFFKFGGRQILRQAFGEIRHRCHAYGMRGDGIDTGAAGGRF